MNDALSIDYASGLAALGGLSYEDAVETLRSELPDVWCDRYRRMCDGPTNILAVTRETFD